MTQDLIQHFQKLNLPNSAIEWLIMLFDCIQSFDDFADNDEVSRDNLNALIWNVLVAMPDNSFFTQHKSTLIPNISNMILKWQASDFVEKNGFADEKSFVWRAGYYDIVLAVVQICHGPQYAIENAHLVLNLYGENYEDYKKEFHKCQTQQ